MNMMTHREILTQGSLDNFGNYAGDVVPDNWLCVMGRNRDSDILEESNWDAALRELGGEDSEAVRIERFGHWAVGWIEMMFVDRRDEDALRVAEEIRDSLECYPVLDDEDFSRRESEAADEAWRDWYTDAERIAYIRDNRQQFEFSDFETLLACARGRVFLGYPSEILY